MGCVPLWARCGVCGCVGCVDVLGVLGVLDVLGVGRVRRFGRVDVSGGVGEWVRDALGRCGQPHLWTHKARRAAPTCSEPGSSTGCQTGQWCSIYVYLYICVYIYVRDVCFHTCGQAHARELVRAGVLIARWWWWCLENEAAQRRDEDSELPIGLQIQRRSGCEQHDATRG